MKMMTNLGIEQKLKLNLKKKATEAMMALAYWNWK
jgi:hypothetical protein